VDEARKILGFDGPDYKDRFATVRRFNQIHAAKITAAGNAVGAPEAVASTTAVHVGSPPSGVVVTNAAESDPGGMPISGARPKKCKSSNRSSSSSASGLSCYGIGEDPQKKKKKSEKKKKRRVPESDDGLIHYTDLLRKYPAENIFSKSTNTAGSLSERLPTTTHNHQSHSWASASSSSSSSRKPTNIHNAPWIHAKVSGLFKFL
jgi:hypothetical protein